MTSSHILANLYLVVVFGFFFVLEGKATDEVTNNKVTVVFDSVTLAAWNKDHKTPFQKAVSAVANGYCSKNTAKCSLNFWNITRKFEPSNVAIISGFPQRTGDDLELQFYVTLPLGQDLRQDSKTVLAAPTLEEIVKANKQNISNAVGTDIKSINGDESNNNKQNKSDHTMNYIMIPVAFGILIIICVLACCLHHLKAKQAKKNMIERQRKMELIEQSKAKYPTMQEEQGIVSQDVPSKKRHVKRKKKKRNYDEEMGSSDDTSEGHVLANDPRVSYENEEQLSPQSKLKHKPRKHRGQENQQPVEEEDEEDGSIRRHHKGARRRNKIKEGRETDEVDTEQPERRKKKKKKHKKKYTSQVNNGGYGGDQQRLATIMSMSDSQLNQLPSIRNLPPLKTEKQNVEA